MATKKSFRLNERIALVDIYRLWRRTSFFLVGHDLQVRILVRWIGRAADTNEDPPAGTRQDNPCAR